MLAYQYLTEEHPEAAVREFKIVTGLQPKDTLSAQLIQQLEQSQNQPGGRRPAAGAAATGDRTSAGESPRHGQGRKAGGKLDGSAG